MIALAALAGPAAAQDWRVSSDQTVGGFIDAVWIFDLKSKKGRKLALPEVGFANDPAVMGKVLFISDNRKTGKHRVLAAGFKGPADFTVIQLRNK